VKIHEYQAKILFAEFGIPVPRGGVAKTASEAGEIAAELGGKVVLKAQVHAGGRGKAGGIKTAEFPDEAARVAAGMLGRRLVTHLGGAPVDAILVEEAVGIGGDPIIGTTFVEALELFQRDPATEAIVLIGEIGGTAEQEAAAFIKERVTKPVAAFIAGSVAPPGRRMGHAGAIVTGTAGRAEEKKRTLAAVGVRIAQSPAEIPAKIGR